LLDTPSSKNLKQNIFSKNHVSGTARKIGVTFIWWVTNNFKSLIIPSFLIGSFVCLWLDLFIGEGISVRNFFAIDYKQAILVGGGGAWFLSALFLSKVIYRLMVL